MYNLFLDDIRQPMTCYNYMPASIKDVYSLEKWVIVRDYDDFVKVITEKGLPDLISFDHDLADIHYNPETWTESFVYKEKTGKDCAQWLVDYCLDNELPLPQYIVHSMNPVGKKNILSLLNNFKAHIK